MRPDQVNSTFLKYLIENEIAVGEKLPRLTDISEELNVSIGKLREEIAAARSMGFLSSKPRVGTIREAFDFKAVILQGTLFALASGEASFEQLSQIRRHVEGSLWAEAVSKLTPEDVAALRGIVSDALAKLQGEQITIPHREHRAYHMKMFCHLGNPFVLGLLEAYWDAYEMESFGHYQSYDYWQTVWQYHGRIVETIADKEFITSKRLLLEHFNLLKTTRSALTQNGKL